MESELNVNVCQIIPRNANDHVAWVFINVESLSEDTGSHARLKIEIPIRMDEGDTPIMTDIEAMRKAKALLTSAIADL